MSQTYIRGQSRRQVVIDLDRKRAISCAFADVKSATVTKFAYIYEGDVGSEIIESVTANLPRRIMIARTPRRWLKGRL